MSSPEIRLDRRLCLRSPAPFPRFLGFMPSYVYRQLSEFYAKQDYSLSKSLEAALSLPSSR